MDGNGDVLPFLLYVKIWFIIQMKKPYKKLVGDFNPSQIGMKIENI